MLTKIVLTGAAGALGSRLRAPLAAMCETLMSTDLAPALDWLKANIWTQASRWTTDELAVRASGEPLNPAHFKAHLVRRYLA